MPTHPKLIETGRALRASDKEGGRTLANSNTRLRSTIPLAAENFHQALDDLESDIVNNLPCIVVEFMLIHKPGPSKGSITSRSGGATSRTNRIGKSTSRAP